MLCLCVKREGPTFLVCIRHEVGSKSNISRLTKDQTLPQVPNITMPSVNVSDLFRSSGVGNYRRGSS